MTGILASLVFSTTFLIVSFVAHGRPWLAFWITNTVLVLIFGGAELYGLLAVKDNPAIRFGGARLSVDGHITAAGFASLAFDVSIGTLCNFFGFYLSQIFIKRFVE
ncbi:hypothetical protein IVB14_32115 [Bradyrhizobium sp. 180]|uniref:hypothetical protein n=1 Tax=Bradyrhizobium sp. 180 TaxID=2782650 RepID=UPI001FF853BC|nr:hypothetical protein [Bradyrhizobium sp. 180]MCK1494930.1 hypothetical protein [Bradyrhizobium sp. 180]